MSDSPLPWKWAEHSQCLSLLVSYPVFPRKTETLKVGLKCYPCLPQFLTLSLVCWLIGFLPFVLICAKKLQIDDSEL